MILTIIWSTAFIILFFSWLYAYRQWRHCFTVWNHLVRNLHSVNPNKVDFDLLLEITGRSIKEMKS